MKLNKTQPSKESEMDMTPMIDIVFQLIIFFMLITDMSQKELETLILPVAITASPDTPDPTEIRPVVNIVSDGSIYVMGELKFDPENDDGYLAVKAYLQQQLGTGVQPLSDIGEAIAHHRSADGPEEVLAWQLWGDAVSVPK